MSLILEDEVRFHTEPSGRLVLDQAPPTARVNLDALRSYDQRLVRISGSVIRFADQVTYLVTGWDPDQAALIMSRMVEVPPKSGNTNPAVTAPAPPSPDWGETVPHTTV